MMEWLHPARWAGTQRNRLYASLAALLLLLAAGLWLLRPQPSTVTIAGLDTPVTFQTTEKSLADALKQHGIQLGAKDAVNPPLNTPLTKASMISVHVEKAVPVTVAVDGKEIKTETVSKTVGQLLAELDVKVSPTDRLSAEPTASVESGMSVKIVRVSEETRVTEVEIPYQIVKREDGDMDEGETKDIQSGQAGVKQIKTVVHLEDGKEVKAEVVDEVVVKPPQDRIIAYGTTGVVSRGGTNLRYTRQVTMSATGYTAGKESNPDGNGYTYTGMRAQRGVVAVDPNVIPLYTRLYIEGYGHAIAADIGGAIRGNKIDLCFDSLDEALSWGRRPAQVYILKN